MSDSLIAALGGLVTAIIAGLYGVLQVRSKPKTDVQDALLDQLQEELRARGEQFEKLNARVDQLEREVHRLLTRDGLWQVHVERLEGVLQIHQIEIPARPMALRHQEPPGD